ncbi:MAG: heme o synthase [Deltaproteobacteria bacterium]|nr:heme o synthase [Deltaproteobacteria bacterium]
MSRAAVATSISPRDLIALTKPRITFFALITAAGGVALAPGSPAASLWIPLLVGTGLIVGAANTLNMYLERELDCRMARTKNRPLPAGRLAPEIALVFGLILAAISVPILSLAVNPMTAILGLIALVAYVMMYTPLKQRSTLSLLVGSVPGAMPVLMGWSAATGGVEAGGLAVFGVMFLWQIPHFHAIALFRSKDYHRAGHKILPVEGGEVATRRSILLYLAAQVQLSLLLFPMNVAGEAYVAVAVVLGTVYFGYALWGVIRGEGPRWAKRLFFMSLLYLPILFAAMVLDGVQ